MGFFKRLVKNTKRAVKTTVKVPVKLVKKSADVTKRSIRFTGKAGIKTIKFAGKVAKAGVDLQKNAIKGKLDIKGAAKMALLNPLIVPVTHPKEALLAAGVGYAGIKAGAAAGLTSTGSKAAAVKAAAVPAIVAPVKSAVVGVVGGKSYTSAAAVLAANKALMAKLRAAKKPPMPVESVRVVPDVVPVIKNTPVPVQGSGEKTGGVNPTVMAAGGLALLAIAL